MSADLYTRPRHEGTTHRVKQRLLIDKPNNRFINPGLFNLFKFANFGYGDQLNVVNVIEATITLTVDDSTEQVTGLAEMEGIVEFREGKNNFQVHANFRDGQLNGDCDFSMTYGGGELQLDQAHFIDGECVASLDLSYDYAMLKFNKHVSLWLPEWSPPEVWYKVDEHNTFLNVTKLLNLYPDLISDNWNKKITIASQLFTYIDSGF